MFHVPAPTKRKASRRIGFSQRAFCRFVRRLTLSSGVCGPKPFPFHSALPFADVLKCFINDSSGANVVQLSLT